MLFRSEALNTNLDWQSAVNSESECGLSYIYTTNIEYIDTDKNEVNKTFKGDVIVSTIPWTSVKKISGIDSGIENDIASLKHTSIVTEYHSERLDTPAHWIYYPDPSLSYHRILVRHNFCPDSNGYWTETNADRFEDNGEISFMNEYAYPLNTIGKQEAIGRVLNFMEKKNIYGLGRWGEWQHYNSDLVVERAMNLASVVLQ